MVCFVFFDEGVDLIFVYFFEVVLGFIEFVNMVEVKILVVVGFFFSWGMVFGFGFVFFLGINLFGCVWCLFFFFLCVIWFFFGWVDMYIDV